MSRLVEITTPEELSSYSAWRLSRKLVELAPADLRSHGVLTPSAVEVWAR